MRSQVSGIRSGYQCDCLGSNFLNVRIGILESFLRLRKGGLCCGAHSAQRIESRHANRFIRIRKGLAISATALSAWPSMRQRASAAWTRTS